MKIFSVVEENVIENDLENINFLETFVEPWDTVIEKWRATFIARQKIINSSIPTIDYLNQFPCLHQPEGPELVKQIFFQNL